MNFLEQNILYLIKEKALKLVDFENQTAILMKNTNFDILKIEQLFQISSFFNLPIDKLIKQNISKENSIISKIKMLILDVDGVLTDGGVYYSESGHDTKKFNVRDGMGIIQLGKTTFLLELSVRA
jgi:hypothetical protein